MPFNDQAYWRERHATTTSRLEAVGFSTFSDEANHFSYRIVMEQYERLLDQLDLPSGSTVLDAGAGVGIFTKLLADRGFDVTAVDISQAALDRIDVSGIKKLQSALSTIPLPDRSFDAVHSFDVLYHIIDDTEWRRSLETLARIGRRYVVLHERFLRTRPVYTSKIIRFRSRSQTAAVLRDCGYVEVASIPTHLVAQQLLTYEIAKRRPSAFYRFDRAALDKLERVRLGGVGSHHIKAYERRM